MAFQTLTRYLKLKVDSDLSADAVYNLQRIDALASTFVVDSTEKLKIQSKANIEIEPNDTALSGSGTGGSVEFGTSTHNNIHVKAFSASFKVDSGIETKNQASDKQNYLKFVFNSSEIADKILTFDLGASNRSISFDGDGTVVVKDSNGDFTVAGDITAVNFVGDLTGDVTGNVSGTAGNVTASSNSTLVTLSSLSLPGSQVTGNISGNAANVTGTVAIANGGTGATTAAAAAEALLPSYASNNNKVLALNSAGTGLEWVAAGSGTLTAVTAVAPLSVDTSIATEPEVSISQADTSTDGYLSSTDWNTFNDKEPAIASGTTSQYWRGDKSWQTLDKSAVGLGNVDNTSDANKPVSSATQTALNAKYDASNPSNFVDASGAKTAAVVNSTAGSETDQAPSVSAIKSYVDASTGPRFSTTWTVAEGNTKVVTHNLDTKSVSVTIYDEYSESVWVDTVTRTDVDFVTLVRVGTALGTWTVVVNKI